MFLKARAKKGMCDKESRQRVERKKDGKKGKDGIRLSGMWI